MPEEATVFLRQSMRPLNCCLPAADVGGEAGTGVVEGVDDAEGTGTGKTAGGHVDGEELGKFGVLVGLGEHGLDGVLEGEVEGLGGEVTDDVGQVTTPEGTDALLGGNAAEAVYDTGVSGDLSADNLGVGILGLDEELNTLDGSGARLGDGTGHATGDEVEKEIASRGHGRGSTSTVRYERLIVQRVRSSEVQRSEG